ncbi:hypothetical protein AgCh_039763 [Apium graveolens]
MERVDESTVGDMVIPAHYAPKDPSKYTETEKEKVSLDSGLQLILIESLHNVMYNNIVNCDTAKYIWEKIEIPCEGTEEVRSNQRRILVSQYEGFMAKHKEGITKVFLKESRIRDSLPTSTTGNQRLIITQLAKVAKRLDLLTDQRRQNLDDTDDEDETEEFGNYALMTLERGKSSSSKSEVPTLTTIDLNTSQYKETVEKMSVKMFHIHTSMVAATEEVSRLSKLNENLEIEKQDLELQLVELETVCNIP